jgi:CheY-like chemotaxis protein
MNKKATSIIGSNVLVIEDHPILLRNISFLLEVAELNAIPVSNRQEALQALNRRTPDVILCDVDVTHGEDGYEIIRRIQADSRYAHIPFIVVSQEYELHDLMYALDLGASEYLPKPFDAYEMLDAIKETLLRHAPVRQLAAS